MSRAAGHGPLLPAALLAAGLLLMPQTARGQYKGFLPGKNDFSYAIHPVPAKTWRRPLPSDSLSLLTRRILEHCCRFALNQWRTGVRHYPLSTRSYFDTGGREEKHIRPLAHEAFLLALCLRLNICTPEATGVRRKDALRFTDRLIASIASRHTSCCDSLPAWGNQWQSALWAAQCAWAAWILWNRLEDDTKALVTRMLVHEADRFTSYTVPYYRSRRGTILFPGDTKAEENAWNSNILTMALCMMPRHPNHEAWSRKNKELQLSAYARPEDLTHDRVVDGLHTARALQGSNMNSDGTVVNHGRLHPDYMVAFMHNGINAWAFSMAGRQPLMSSTFNGDIIYRALTQKRFGPDSLTIYLRDSLGRATPRMHFPEGNDWGTGRQANYWLMDVMAHLFGLDRGLNPPARSWALERARFMERKMRQSPSGRFFQSRKENRFDSAEEFFAAQIALGYLGLYLGGR